MNPPAVQYATTADGRSIAFGVSGAGRPLVFLPLTFSHVQLSWNEDSPLRQWLTGLAERFRLVQYDGRGQGMSSRGLNDAHSGADELQDLDAVVERLGLERVVLLARGPLGHAALRYAAAHPERVEALVLFSLPAHGGAWPASFARGLAADHWDLFLQSFTAFDGRTADTEATVRRMAQTVTQEDWACMIHNWIASDVRDLLPSISVPALVIHPRDVIQPRAQESMALAAGLPNSRLVITDGANQLGDPEQGLQALDQFMASLQRTREATAGTSLNLNAPALAKLSPRELEVMRLLAAGRTNREIAAELTISLNTVRHHVTSILDKTGSTNRTEAVALALRSALV